MKDIYFASARSKNFSYQTSMVAKLENMLVKMMRNRVASGTRKPWLASLV